MRAALLVAVLLAGVGIAVAGVHNNGSLPTTSTPARVEHPRPKPPPPPVRPPQFIVVGFDGAGGLQMWQYWLRVARKAHAHFTFFVSGAYLLDWAHRNRYHPPKHEPGTSAIGFAQESGDLTVPKTLAGIVAGYRAGHEIGTHYNGHFCAPDPEAVGNWTTADWESELAQFKRLLFGTVKLPFGPHEVVGSRTPCLEGNPGVLYPVLARHGFRYDASRQAALGAWPRRVLGLWSFPLLEIPFVGHTFRVVSMDYNLLANQVDESPARAENETYRSLWNAFLVEYVGRRAPLTIGHHFETWKSWAYNRALARFLVKACRLPEVRCVDYRTLAAFLDSVPRKRLRRYVTGHFPPPAKLRTILIRPG